MKRMKDIGTCSGCMQLIERRTAYAENWRGETVLARFPVYYIVGSTDTEHPFPCDQEITEEAVNALHVHQCGSLENWERVRARMFERYGWTEDDEWRPDERAVAR